MFLVRAGDILRLGTMLRLFSRPPNGRAQGREIPFVRLLSGKSLDLEDSRMSLH